MGNQSNTNLSCTEASPSQNASMGIAYQRNQLILRNQHKSCKISLIQAGFSDEQHRLESVNTKKVDNEFGTPS